MNHWIWLVSLVGILSTAVVFGTDMFFLTIGRAALRMASPSAGTEIMGFFHLFADARMPIGGVSAILSNLLLAVLSRSGQRWFYLASLLMLILFVILYNVLSSVNAVLPAEKLRRLIHAASPDLAVYRIRTQRALVERSLVQEHMLSQVSAGFGTLGLLMAAFGLAGTVGHSITRRAKEFGVRLALGARSTELTRMVLRRSLWPVTVGLMIGLPIGLACMRLLRSALFGAGPSDVLTTAGAVLVLGSTATMAVWVPAYRASQIDPAAAIRDE